MITEQQVRDLSAHASGAPVATVYLDVDGRHRPVATEYQSAFERLATTLRRRASREPSRADVEADIERMRTWLDRDLDRSFTRGVAFFSCEKDGFFEAVPLPRPVRDAAAIGTTPQVGQLLAILDEHERFLVVLVDRHRVRLLRFELGEADEVLSRSDAEPRAIDISTELGSFERHADEVARRHLRRSAADVARALREWPADRIILGGPDESVAGLQKYLAADVRAKVVGRADVRVAAPPAEIVAVALDVEERIERQREAEAVEELRQRSVAGKKGVVGLTDTLAALTARRVGTLFLTDGFSAPGAICPDCDNIGVAVRQCPRCGATQTDVDDVVEVAIDEAAAQKATVEFCRATDLERFGNIGAILRY